MSTDPNQNVIKRRRSPRIVGPFKAQWCGVLRVPLMIKDLSLGGCFVLMANRTLPAKRMRIELLLPHVEAIVVEGNPLYARDDGFAVQFVDMPEATYKRLQAILATLSPTQSAA